jgi:HK97 family phage prohead protease
LASDRQTRDGGVLIEIRADGAEIGAGIADLLTYGVLDTFNTTFEPRCFEASYRAQMPVVAWGHNWADPIGRWLDFEERGKTLRGRFQLDDFDAVPRARQAYVQMKSGTLTDFSVGFGAPKTKQSDQFRASRALAIYEARLDEGSPVIRGSVAGSKLVHLRASGLAVVDGVLDANDARTLVERLSRGELSLPEALEELNGLVLSYDEIDADDADGQTHSDPPEPDDEPEDQPEDEPDAEPDILDSPEVAEALARVADLMEA